MFCGFKVTARVRMLSVGIDAAPQKLFCHSFFVLLMIHCSKSAQKSAVQMCQVAVLLLWKPHSWF